ncbi:MAG: helix-turn-helix transcriptional regulator [Proteobacteria bacterium]|nr:helix-turn-helix transcriptional regulator [Pseudomonadota bacterium]
MANRKDSRRPPLTQRPKDDPWVDPDDAPEITDEWLDRAEIRKGDRVIRPGRPPLNLPPLKPSPHRAADIVRASQKAIAAGREVALPKATAARIMEGENPVKVIREWRGISAAELGKAAGIALDDVSNIEDGRRGTKTAERDRIAAALRVPAELLN